MAEKKQIYELMANIQADVEAIAKERRNQQQNYNFRGVEDVLNMMHKLLAKHGVFVVTRRVGAGQLERRPGNGTKVVTSIINDFEFDFCAPDGSKVTVGPVPGEGLDYSDKASNKTMANAYKYCMFLTFSIPTQGLVNEPDADSPQQEAPKSTNSGQKQREVEPQKSGPKQLGDMDTLRQDLEDLLASGNFNEREIKQARAMAGKIKDAASMANMIRAWEKKDSGKDRTVAKEQQKMSSEQMAEAVQGEVVEDPAQGDLFDDDIPF
jgi:hypothetical protein